MPKYPFGGNHLDGFALGAGEERLADGRRMVTMANIIVAANIQTKKSMNAPTCMSPALMKLDMAPSAQVE